MVVIVSSCTTLGHFWISSTRRSQSPSFLIARKITLTPTLTLTTIVVHTGKLKEICWLERSKKQDSSPRKVLLSLFGACRDYLRGSVTYASTVQLPITQNHSVTATATEVCYCPASTDHISGFGTRVKHIGWQAERNLHSHNKCCRNRLVSASVITYEDLAPRVQLASY